MRNYKKDEVQKEFPLSAIKGSAVTATAAIHASLPSTLSLCAAGSILTPRSLSS